MPKDLGMMAFNVGLYSGSEDIGLREGEKERGALNKDGLTRER